MNEKTLRRWEQFGLVRPHGDRLDFRDLVSLRSLAHLVQEGMTPAVIARSLERLACVLPDAVQPLAQARIINEAGALVAELQGARINARGQLLLDLEWEERPEPASSVPLEKREHEDAEVWFDDGLDYEAQAQWRQAAQAYQRVLQLSPTFAEAHFNLANVQHQQGDLEAAEWHYHQAVQHDPELACGWYNLGYVLDEQDRVGKAIDALRHALQLAPNYPDARFNLALCYERLDSHEDATPHWQAYLRLDPNGEWAEIARQHLANQ